MIIHCFIDRLPLLRFFIVSLFSWFIVSDEWPQHYFMIQLSLSELFILFLFALFQMMARMIALSITFWYTAYIVEIIHCFHGSLFQTMSQMTGLSITFWSTASISRTWSLSCRRSVSAWIVCSVSNLRITHALHPSWILMICQSKRMRSKLVSKCFDLKNNLYFRLVVFIKMIMGN